MENNSMKERVMMIIVTIFLVAIMYGIGTEVGKMKGYTQGAVDGETAGKLVGYNQGYDAAKVPWYNAGYNKGSSDGLGLGKKQGMNIATTCLTAADTHTGIINTAYSWNSYSNCINNNWNN